MFQINFNSSPPDYHDLTAYYDTTPPSAVNFAFLAYANILPSSGPTNDLSCFFDTAWTLASSSPMRYTRGPMFCLLLPTNTLVFSFGDNRTSTDAWNSWNVPMAYSLNFTAATASLLYNKWVGIGVTVSLDDVNKKYQVSFISTIPALQKTFPSVSYVAASSLPVFPDFALRIGRGLNSSMACAAIYSRTMNNSDVTALATTCEALVAAGMDTCGNGAIDGYEECDDGNAVSGDGCSETCQREGRPMHKFYKAQDLLGFWPLTRSHGLREVGFRQFNGEVTSGGPDYYSFVSPSKGRPVVNAETLNLYQAKTSISLAPVSWPAGWPAIDISAKRAFSFGFHFMLTSGSMEYEATHSM